MILIYVNEVQDRLGDKTDGYTTILQSYKLTTDFNLGISKYHLKVMKLANKPVF